MIHDTRTSARHRGYEDRQLNDSFFDRMETISFWICTTFNVILKNMIMHMLMNRTKATSNSEVSKGHAEL